MNRSARKTAVFAFSVGVLVALAAWAGTDYWFEATGTATTTDANTQLDQHRLHFTSGSDNIQFRGSNDVINFGEGSDLLMFNGASGDTERILFSADQDAGLWYRATDEELEVASDGDVVIVIGAE